MEGSLRASPAVADLDGDGGLELVHVGRDGRITVRTLRLAGTGADMAAQARAGNAWALVTLAEEALRSSPEDARAFAHLGTARWWLGQPKEALAALRRARELGIRSPENATREWLAGWVADAADPREAIDGILAEALDARFDAVFDTLVVDVRRTGMSPPAEAFRALGALVREGKAPVEAALLLGVAHGLAGEFREPLLAARERVSARIREGEGVTARLHGYLTLLAHLLGDRPAFERLYMRWREFPRRPEELDRLLAEIAAQ
jgi:hypothetical protein